MKEHLKRLLAGGRHSPGDGRALAREYLQARILRLLQEAGAFTSWAFVGGTALRFLHDIPRFSEDLDFSLRRGGEELDFPKIITSARRGFEADGYTVSAKVGGGGALARADLKFPGLPFELGLSGHGEEVLSIKIEVDTNPPEGAGFEVSTVRRHEIVRILHHDRPSLMAGKLNAILSRSWLKGRDLYDIVWYLSERTWPNPNLNLLKNSLSQYGLENIDVEHWQSAVIARISGIDWEKTKADVLPFLERGSDIQLISHDVVHGLLERSSLSEKVLPFNPLVDGGGVETEEGNTDANTI